MLNSNKQELQAHFIEIREYRNIYKNLEEQQIHFEDWIAYYRSKLSLTPIKKNSASNAHTPYLPLTSYYHIPIITTVHSQKFLEFAEPFGNSQYRINIQFLQAIKQNLGTKIPDSLLDLKAIVHEIEGIIKAIHQEIEPSVYAHNLSKILCSQVQEHFILRKDKAEYYRERSWEDRIDKANQLLEQIEFSKKTLKMGNLEDKQAQILQNLKRLHLQICKFRRKIMHFKSTLVNSYLQICKKFSKGLYEMISIGYQIIKNFISELQQSLPFRNQNSEILQEYENCKQTKNAQYIRGLQLLKNLYLIQKPMTTLISLSKIFNNFYRKQNQLNNFKFCMEAFDLFYRMKENISRKIDDKLMMLKKEQNFECEEAEDVIHNFLCGLRNNYHEILEYCTKIDEGLGKNNERSRSRSSNKLSLYQVWPHKEYIWLWNQFNNENIMAYLLQKKQSFKDLQTIKQKILTYKNFALQITNKPNPQSSQLLPRQKCKLYQPLLASDCQLIVDKTKIKIIVKKNMSFMIPKKQIKTSEIYKDEKLKIILENGLQFKMGGFKSKSVLENILKSIKKNPPKNEVISMSRMQKFKSENSEQSEKMVRGSVERVRSSRKRKSGEISKKQKECIERRRLEVQKQVYNILQYEKYQQFQVFGCSLKEIYQLIFSDQEPYFANKEFPNFFAYMANILGDKNYETGPYDNPGPKCITGNKNVTYEKCPIFSQRYAKMVHPLPKIPFIPSTCQCDQTAKIFWIDNKELIYSAEVKLSGASMFKGVVTKTLYKVVQFQKQCVRIEIYGKFQIEGKNSFGAVLRKAGKIDMQNVVSKISYELQTAIDTYKSVHRPNKKISEKSDSVNDISEILTEQND